MKTETSTFSQFPNPGALPAVFLCLLILGGCEREALMKSPSTERISEDGEPGVQQILRRDFYTVEGANVPELLSSMKGRRPFEYNAYTDWHIDWNYSFLVEPESCHLISFDVRLQVRQTLPRWSRREGASISTREKWDRYLKAVIVHEDGHAAIGLAAAEEMLKSVEQGDWHGATREGLRARIDKHCQNILERYRQKELKYDRDTDHGRTEGARLGSSPTEWPAHTIQKG